MDSTGLTGSVVPAVVCRLLLDKELLGCIHYQCQLWDAHLQQREHLLCGAANGMIVLLSCAPSCSRHV